MLIKKKEKELRDLLEIYKEENRKLKSDYIRLEQLYDIQLDKNKMLTDINEEKLGEKFDTIIGITKRTYEPIIYIHGIEVPEVSSLILTYKYMEIPTIEIKY